MKTVIQFVLFSIYLTHLVQKCMPSFALSNCGCLHRAGEPFCVSSEGGSYTFFQAEHICAKDRLSPLS